jgi:uncharacterized protein with PIN domain
LEDQQPPRHTGIVVAGVADNERVHVDNRDKGSGVKHPVNTCSNRAVETEEKNQAGMVSYQTYNCYEEMMRCHRPLWNGEQYEEKAQIKTHDAE